MFPRLPARATFVANTKNVSDFVLSLRSMETQHSFCVPRVCAPKKQCVLVCQYLKGTGKRGHIVADTLLLMMFLGLRKLGNICCGHKMFLNKIRNMFCFPDTKFVSTTNVARVGKRRNFCVGNNVSATMCPRLPGP